MYIIDFVCCSCYMMLRKFHYADWDAKYTAVLNTSVVVGMLVYAMMDILLLLAFPGLLQDIYNYPKVRIVISDIVVLMLLILRYYFCKINILHAMSRHFKKSRINNGYILTLITVAFLIGAFFIPFFIFQYIKAQGII